MWRRSDQSLRRLKVFYTLLLCSISFSLLIFEFCCGLWCRLWSETERERESSLSFWTDSLSLSLYNYSIYLPLFFFYFIRWCVTVLVSWCWWVFILMYCDLWLAIKKHQFICPCFFFFYLIRGCVHTWSLAVKKHQFICPLFFFFFNFICGCVCTHEVCASVC